MSLSITLPFMSLPDYQARVIMFDPPWHFVNYSKKGEQKNPTAHYDCMPRKIVYIRRYVDEAAG